jgi:DNA-directed RNA polymerase subunit RPC12/RpoP
MALINCPECGKQISDKALACPNCGNPMNQQPQQNQQEEYLCCPRCGSREIHAERKGFSGGKALAGALITGGIGLLAGTIGSNNTQITCLKCGYKFKAGEAVVKSPDSKISDEEAEIIAWIQKGKLQAIKNYKDSHNCSLEEAKNVIDAMAAKHPSLNAGQGCSIIILIGISITLGAIALL